MTSIEALQAPGHSFGWRLVTSLWVGLALTTGFILGNVLAGRLPIDAVYLSRTNLAIFGIQVGGILLWLGFDAIRRRITFPRIKLPRVNLRRRWWRLRARIRKRLIRDRSKRDYRSAEGSILVPLVIVGGLFSLSLVTMNMPVAASRMLFLFVLTATAIFVTTVVALQYRGATERPVSVMIRGALLGLISGYFVELI